MIISFTCPHCQKELRIAEEHAGAKARCSSCDKTVVVPQVLFSAQDAEAAEPAPWVLPIAEEPAEIAGANEAPRRPLVLPEYVNRRVGQIEGQDEPVEVELVGETALQAPVAFKHSGLGIASFVIALGAGVVLAGTVLQMPSTRSMRPDLRSALVNSGLAICAGVAFSLVGAGLGILSLYQPKRRKLWAGLGLTGNAVIVLAVLTAMLVGAHDAPWVVAVNAAIDAALDREEAPQPGRNFSGEPVPHIRTGPNVKQTKGPAPRPEPPPAPKPMPPPTPTASPAVASNQPTQPRPAPNGPNRQPRYEPPAGGVPRPPPVWSADALFAGKILAPDLSGLKPLYDDDFHNPRAEVLQKKFENAEYGYANGKYRVQLAKSNQDGWANFWESSSASFACELTGRVAGPPSAFWGLSITNDEQNRSIKITIDDERRLLLRASEGGAFQGVSPIPFERRFVKPGNESNKLLVIVRGRQVEVYANSIAVCQPISVDRDLTPAVLALGAVSRQTGALVEFERMTVWSADNLPSPRPAPMAVERRVRDFPLGMAQDTLKIAGALEGENLGVVRKSSDFGVYPQNMVSYRYGKWSGDTQLFGRALKAGEWVDLELPVAADGNYQVVVYLTKAPDYGVVQFHLNGKPLGQPVDGFFPRSVVATGAIWLGAADLKKGTATLRIEVVRTNVKSQGGRYFWGLDCVVLKPSPAAATSVR